MTIHHMDCDQSPKGSSAYLIGRRLRREVVSMTSYELIVVILAVMTYVNSAGLLLIAILDYKK